MARHIISLTLMVDVATQVFVSSRLLLSIWDR